MLHSANYGSYALPLSGGTMSGAISTPAGTSMYIGSQNIATSSRVIINWHTDTDYNYLIGKRAGAWTQPMDIAFYTGLRYHAHQTYNGHIFYVAGYDNTEAFSVGRGDGNVRVNNNLFVGGTTTPDVALSVNGAVHFGNGGNFMYWGGTAGSVNSWSSREYSSGGTHTINTSRFVVDRVGYGSQALIDASLGSITLGQYTTISDGARVNGTIRQGNNLSRPMVDWSASGTSTGMVIFYLPGNSGNYGMVHMVFDIYEYSGNTVSTVIVGGHNWNGSWYNIGCNVVGSCGKTVRLGFKDGQYCVVFGGVGSSWSYGTIVLRKIHNGGFYDNNMNLGSGFTASQTNTESFSYVSGDLRNFTTPTTITAGTSIYGNDIYTTGGWFRNHTNNNGIYWSQTGWHIYPNSTSDLNIRSGADGGTLRLMRSDGTTYGYVHWASDRAMGFLTDGGSWRFRVDNSANVSYVSSFSMSGYLYINRTDPTIFLQDTDHRSSMIHCNSNVFYILRGSGTNSTGWSTYNGYWPMTLNLENNDATFGGNITAIYNVTAYSDVRLKQDIETINHAMDKVQQIRGVTFTRTDDVEDVKKRYVGVIAQEIEQVLPEVVSEDKNGIKNVAYGNIVGLLIEAIKEQQKKIEELEQRINNS